MANNNRKTERTSHGDNCNSLDLRLDEYVTLQQWLVVALTTSTRGR